MRIGGKQVFVAAHDLQVASNLYRILKGARRSYHHWKSMSETEAGIAGPKTASLGNEIVERINREMNRGLADGGVRATFSNLAAAPLAMSPTEFGAHVAAETEKWGRVIRTAGIRA